MRTSKLKKVLSLNIYIFIFAFLFNVNALRVFAGSDFGVHAVKYKEGVSYVFVVDVSGSIDDDQYAFMKDIMKEIVDDGNTAGIKILLVGKKVVSFDTVSSGKDAMKHFSSTFPA